MMDQRITDTVFETPRAYGEAETVVDRNVAGNGYSLSLARLPVGSAGC
jgi:hypothetical protein